jgi:hypothetical protein
MQYDIVGDLEMHRPRSAESNQESTSAMSQKRVILTTRALQWCSDGRQIRVLPAARTGTRPLDQAFTTRARGSPPLRVRSLVSHLPDKRPDITASWRLRAVAILYSAHTQLASVKLPIARVKLRKIDP